MLPNQPLGRRNILQGSAALLGSAALPGCATTTMASRMFPRSGCSLHPVKVSASRQIRSLVGLRPFRPSGFVVRGEKFADKRLVHNYGHGGAGITLSWGSSALALREGLQGHSGRVAVIGSGIMGLTTARLLQEAGYAVTMYTAALPPDTTSNIAGGQWFPSLVYRRSALTPEFERQLVAAADYSYRRFQIMIGPRYGVRWMRNYTLSNKAMNPSNTDQLLASMLPETRTLSSEEHPFGYDYVSQFTGMLIEPPIFMRQLLEDFRIAGGEVIVRAFADATQVSALPETLIFNCTGLGAKALFGDGEMQPLRGQLEILLPQPEVDYAVSAPGGLYMFSRSDGIVLGGTTDRGEMSTMPDLETGQALITGHKNIFRRFKCQPALAGLSPTA